jgi:hypothetical protein
VSEVLCESSAGPSDCDDAGFDGDGYALLSWTNLVLSGGTFGDLDFSGLLDVLHVKKRTISALQPPFTFTTLIIRTVFY